jgi:flagellar hook assembly protein FlgD
MNKNNNYFKPTYKSVVTLFIFIFVIVSPTYSALTVSQIAKTQEFRNVEIPFVITNDYNTVLLGEEIYVQNSKGEISVFYNAGGGKIQDLGVKFNSPQDIEYTKVVVDKKTKYMIIADVNGVLKLFNNTGSLLNSINTNQYIIGLALGDIDNDTQNEVAVVTIKENEFSLTGFESKIYTYKYATGVFMQLFTHTYGPYNYNFSCITIADYNNDNKNEILLGTEDGKVVVINPFTWRDSILAFLPIGSIVTDIEVADVDNDKKNETIFTTGYDDGSKLFWQGSLYVYKNLQLQWQSLIFSKAVTSVEVGDVDGDGVKEIVTVANNSDYENQIWDASIWIFKYKSTDKNYIQWQATFPMPRVIFSDIALGDIDGDTKPEILATVIRFEIDEYYSYISAYKIEDRILGDVKLDKDIFYPKSREIINLQYTLLESANVTIKIHDVATPDRANSSNLIREWNYSKSAGSYTHSWNGTKQDQTTYVPDGIYIFIITATVTDATGKVRTDTKWCRFMVAEKGVISGATRKSINYPRGAKIILTKPGDIVKITATTKLLATAYEFSWDGRYSSGDIADIGVYKYEVYREGKLIDQGLFGLVSDFTPPTLTSPIIITDKLYQIDNYLLNNIVPEIPVFNPLQSGSEKLYIYFTTSEWNEYITVEIFNSKGEKIKTLYNPNIYPSLTNFKGYRQEFYYNRFGVYTDTHIYWDGKKEDNFFAPTGTYYAKITVCDVAGNYTRLSSPTFQLIMETIPPTIINNQSNIEWMGVNDRLIDVDFADTESLLSKFQVRSCTATSGGGICTAWTDVITGINAGSYTTNWRLPDSVWKDMPAGKNYISVRCYDNASNVATLNDVFYIIKAPKVNLKSVTDIGYGNVLKVEWDKLTDANIDGYKIYRCSDFFQIKFATLLDFEKKYVIILSIRRDWFRKKI